tara:strand:+ start:11642 stop:12397 length:756 start_codon:yes stop_codon:yes gene_type:complete
MKKKQKVEAKFYKLKRDVAPLTYMLASRNSQRYPLLWFDEEKGINRPLRYARNQKSPFEDEQDGNAILEPIVFEDGVLFVPKTNQVLQKFLYYHPQRDMVFEEINKERDAQEELEYVEAALEAQVIAKNLEFEKLVSVARVLLGSQAEKMSSIELKRDILLYAKESPVDFLDTLNDPMLEMQDTVYQFFNKTYLVFRNGNKDVYFNLPKNKKKLLTVPFGEDPYFIVASHFQSDEGIEIYKILKKRLEKKD